MATTDMDIDMGLDIDIGPEYSTLDLEQETQEFNQPQLAPTSSGPLSTEPGHSDSVSIVSHKIHLRGLDDLTSADIKSFAETYCETQPIEKIEWIDDTSANIIYASPEAALFALEAFVAVDGLPTTHSQLDMLPAKPFPKRPNTLLKVRLAVESDKKKPGARERSRFYLLNPEHERPERRSRDDRGRRSDGRYRDRRDDYRSRAYDNRERRRRSDEFDASLYDDEASLARRSRDSESESGTTSSGYRSHQRGRRVRFTEAEKELFPEKVNSRSNGRLRDRSASPMRDNEGDLRMDARPLSGGGGRAQNANDGGANRRKAQLMRDRLKASASGPIELFPRKAGARLAAFDSTDSTADLFADKLRIPAMDGSNDRSSAKPDLMSRITKPGQSSALDSSNANNSQSNFKIKGAARQEVQSGFSIKGLAAASSQERKELFPGKTSLNSGKELFADRLDGRGGRRQRAEDLFH